MHSASCRQYLSFCSCDVLSHCSHTFRIPFALRDPLFNGVASIIATAIALRRRGPVITTQIATLQQRIQQSSVDDIIQHVLLEAPQPLLLYVVAIPIFAGITGRSLDAHKRECSAARLRKSGLNRVLYAHMKVADRTCAQLERRVVGTGFSWGIFENNVLNIPPNIPRAAVSHTLSLPCTAHICTFKVQA